MNYQSDKSAAQSKFFAALSVTTIPSLGVSMVDLSPWLATSLCAIGVLLLTQVYFQDLKLAYSGKIQSSFLVGIISISLILYVTTIIFGKVITHKLETAEKSSNTQDYTYKRVDNGDTIESKLPSPNPCPSGTAVCIAPQGTGTVNDLQFRDSKICAERGFIIGGTGTISNVYNYNMEFNCKR